MHSASARAGSGNMAEMVVSAGVEATISAISRPLIRSNRVLGRTLVSLTRTSERYLRRIPARFRVSGISTATISVHRFPLPSTNPAGPGPLWTP